MLINFYLALKQISGLNINCATNNDKQSPATLWGRTMYNMLYTVSSRWTPLNLKAESFSQKYFMFFSVMWAEPLGKQLGRPTRSLAGWLVSKWLTAYNQVLEESAVQLCAIQPGDTVLELGHGPGLGLQSAAKLLTGPTGHLIGVDYSEYMHQVR